MEGKNARRESALSTAQLEAEITELAGHLNAAHHRWLALIAEFDRRQGWAEWSVHSCAHWLNWKCGLDLGAAREKVRVAHALERLPRIAAAMARGELSYSKVRALTRVAEPATEAYLLSITLHGTAHHVEALVRHYRRAQEAAELTREARQQARRTLSYTFDDDGSLVVKARLPAESGAVLLRALEAAVGQLPRPDVSAATPDEPRLSLAVRRADALAVMAESFVKHGAEALGGGERQQIVVHVDASTLRDDAAGRCELDDGPALAAETVRRLACDASIVTIVEDERGEPLDVGRKTRSIPPAVRRALRSRDRGCRFPGCTHQRFVDGHHIHHWAHGGETKLKNLVSLCRFHHRQVHEGRVAVRVLDDGALRFVRPDGVAFDSAAPGWSGPVIDWVQLVATDRALGIHVDANTAVTRWRGERMDYGLALEVLFQQAKRGRDVSAETSGQAAPYTSTDLIDHFPPKAKWLMDRGKALGAESRYTELLADLRRAVELDPTADIYYFRGVTQYFLGNDAAAIGDFSQALQRIGK